MLQLAWPWLAAGAVLPVLCAWLLPRALEGGAAMRIPFFAAARAWPVAAATAGRRLRAGIAAIAWLALVLAACRPQWIDAPLAMPVTGRSMLLALDVSQSMGQGDLATTTDGARGATRLQVVQRAADAFIERRAGDRVGLVVFGSAAYLQCPLTFDRDTVRRMVAQLRVGVAGELTSLGDAIGVAVRRLRDMPASERVVVVLTDGANTAGTLEPLDAAGLARHHGVRVHTIGVGGGTPETGADHALLERLARMTGGRHFRAGNAPELERVYAELDALEPSARGQQRFTPARELYHWPLAAALVMAVFVLIVDGYRVLQVRPAHGRTAPAQGPDAMASPSRGPARG